MKKKTAIILAIIFLLLICGGVWAFWGGGPDPQVKKLQEMQKELFGGDKQPTPEQMDQFRKEMEKLTPEQHRQLREPMREQMAQRMNKNLDDYFSLPLKDRKKFLDDRIKDEENRRKEMEKRRKEWEANRGGQGGQGQNGGGPGGSGPNQPGAGQNQPGRGPAGAGGGPPGGRRPSTPEQRSQRRNRMFDNSSPERRAQWNEYRDAMRKRRLELGLPANPWGNRGPR